MRAPNTRGIVVKPSGQHTRDRVLVRGEINPLFSISKFTANINTDSTEQISLRNGGGGKRIKIYKGQMKNDAFSDLKGVR